MKKEFVPYELAVKLKELGFDEECFGYSYRDTPDPKSSLNIYFAKQPINNSSLKEDKGIALPLWQQAFDWFREKYNIHIEVRSYTASRFTYVIQKLEKIVTYLEYGGINNSYSTYQEARQACLEKLIELCKNN